MFKKLLTTKNLGTIFMTVPLILLTYIYLPIIQIYLFPKDPIVDSSVDYFIEIPTIKAGGPLVMNVDPWDENDYLPKLQLGVAHAKGSSLPGEQGTVYLFAHSFDDPWNITRYNTSFFKINQLDLGDEIVIHSGTEKVVYKVSDKKIVGPSEVKYLIEDQGNLLIMQTCTPIGTDWNRLLVFAKPM